MKEIKEMALALEKGSVGEAYEVHRRIGAKDPDLDYEILEVVRQALISYFKKGLVYKARETEGTFKIPKELVEDAVKQAVLSSFREGNVKRVKELQKELPISNSLASELVEFCATWGKPQIASVMREALVE